MTHLWRNTFTVLILTALGVGCGDNKVDPAQAWTVEERPEAANIVEADLWTSSPANAIAPESARIDIETTQPRTCIELSLWQDASHTGRFEGVDVSPNNWALTSVTAREGSCDRSFAPDTPAPSEATAEEARGSIDLIVEYGAARDVTRLELELRFEAIPDVNAPGEIFLDVSEFEHDMGR